MTTIESPAHLKEEAERLLDQADSRRALSLLAPVLDQEPDDPEARALIGIAHMMNGDHAAGLHHLERSVELEPYESLYRSNLGYAYQYLGRIPEAIDAYQAAVDLNPRSERAKTALETLTGSAYVPQPAPERDLFGDSLAEPAMMRSTDDPEQDLAGWSEDGGAPASSDQPASDGPAGSLMIDFWGDSMVDSGLDLEESPAPISGHEESLVSSLAASEGSSHASEESALARVPAETADSAVDVAPPAPPEPPAWVSVRLGSAVSVVSGDFDETVVNAALVDEVHISHEDLPASESQAGISTSPGQKLAPGHSQPEGRVEGESPESAGLVDDGKMRTGSAKLGPEAPEVSPDTAVQQVGENTAVLLQDPAPPAITAGAITAGDESIAPPAAVEAGSLVQDTGPDPASAEIPTSGMGLEEAVDQMPGVAGATSDQGAALPVWDLSRNTAAPTPEMLGDVCPQDDKVSSMPTIVGSMGDEPPVIAAVAAMDDIPPRTDCAPPVLSAYQGGLRGCRGNLAKPSTSVSGTNAGGSGGLWVRPLILVILVCLALCAGSYVVGRHLKSHQPAAVAQAQTTRPVAALPARTH